MTTARRKGYSPLGPPADELRGKAFETPALSKAGGRTRMEYRNRVIENFHARAIAFENRCRYKGVTYCESVRALKGE